MKDARRDAPAVETAAPDDTVGVVLASANGEPASPDPAPPVNPPLGSAEAAEAAAAMIESIRETAASDAAAGVVVEPAVSSPDEPNVATHPTTNLSLRILAGIAVFVALFLGKAFFLGVAFALIMKLALARPTRFLARTLRLPMPIASAFIVLLVVTTFSLVIWRLSAPALAWVERLPQTIDAIRTKLDPITDPVDRVAQISKTVEDLASPEPAGANQVAKVAVVEDPQWLSIVSYELWSFLVQGTITLTLLYFMLATDEMFLRKCVEILPRMDDKKLAVETGRAIESDISNYLFSVTLINFGVGVVLAIAFPLVGLPNPVLFAVMAAVLTYIPYIGPALGISVVAAVSLMTFGSLAEAVVPPAVYFLTNFVEGMFVTPLVLGKRLTLSPVVLFIWLLLWTFLWGIPGALIAVPLLSIVKITCDHVPRLKPIAVLIGA